ncbi:5-(carboxyamino)imidazole ribonucleotide synthase [Bacillus gobiensis]|uniref:5-(carboxyamino)imidazole ribonucleotide synthase n=1 Tax=Bacillus gobiensis TaxID=1441095 RepID=UPI003D1D7F50
MISLSNQLILPGSTIGIIGGGQLGKHMAISAKNMGYKVAVLDPTPGSPCGQVSDQEITAGYGDFDAIQSLAEISDVITYEFENIDYDSLVWLKENAYLPQGSELLLMTQNRETEKKGIEQAGCTVAPYRVIHSIEDLQSGLNALGFPAVLKTCRGGYDGKGQHVLRSKEQLTEAAKLLEHGTCVLESWIPFEMELSVIVTRSVTGEMTTFPVAENIHKNNVLFQSIVPARAAEEVEREATELAIQLAEHVKLVGTLAVELFLTKDGKLYVNELAPRPHNSGHYTLDLTETSQFEQHIRAVCGLPLGKTKLLQSGVMVNMLGKEIELIQENLNWLQDAKLYLYGKHEAKPGRKMGHITFVREPNENLIKELTAKWTNYAEVDQR